MLLCYYITTSFKEIIAWLAEAANKKSAAACDNYYNVLHDKKSTPEQISVAKAQMEDGVNEIGRVLCIKSGNEELSEVDKIKFQTKDSKKEFHCSMPMIFHGIPPNNSGFLLFDYTPEEKASIDMLSWANKLKVRQAAFAANGRSNVFPKMYINEKRKAYVTFYVEGVDPAIVWYAAKDSAVVAEL